MKNLIIFLFLFGSVAAYSQVPYFVPRSTSLVTAADARLKATLNFYLPVGPDTTLNGGIDSVGALFFKWADTSVYIRVPKTGVPGNKWVVLFKLNSSPQTAGVVSFNGRNGVVTLLSGDVTGALGYTPVTNARTLSINGNTQDLTANRSWTVGDVRTDGSYANPAWITSLAWSKITGAPSFSGITSLGGLTASSQTFGSIGNSGTFPNWVSSGSTHTLNLPMAATSGVTAGLITNAFYNSIVTLNASQTLTNKTLTSPFINFGTNANGDMIVRLSGAYTRVPVGAEGQAWVVSGGLPSWQTLPTGTGTVTNFSSGGLSPLFTTNVATATTTPALSFSLSNASQYTIFGRNASGTGAPAYFTPLLASPLFGNQGTASGVLHGNAFGSPSWGPVDLSTEVTGNLSVNNLNSGSGATANTFWAGDGTWKGTGTVTTFSAGNLSPLFTTSVNTASSTPSLSFALSNATAYQVLGRAAGTGAPSYQSLTADFIPSLLASKISNFSPTARGLFSVTTIGSSGAATYNSSTGVFNIPIYSAGGPGGASTPPVTINYNTGATDTTRMGVATDRNMWAYKVFNYPSYKINGYEGFVAYGDTFRTPKPAQYTIRNLGAFPSNVSDSLQAIFDNPDISSVVVEWDSTAVYNITVPVNAHGKTINPMPGVKFAFSGGGSLDSAIFVMTPYQNVFDTTASGVMTNVYTASGIVTPLNFGGSRGASANNGRYLQHAIDFAANNRLSVTAPTTMYINNNIQLRPFTKIDGANIVMNRGNVFNTFGIRCDSLILKNISVQYVGAVGLNIHPFTIESDGQPAYGLLMDNVRLQQARTGYYGMFFRNQYNATIQNCFINESSSTSMFADSCYNIRFYNNNVTNAGRGGIGVWKDNDTWYIDKNTVYGVSQYENLQDGCVEVYGSRNRRGKITNNILDPGTTRVTATVNHRGIRIKAGEDIDVIGNTVTSTSPYLHSAIDESNRDDSISKNVRFVNNTILIKGGYFERAVMFAGAREYIFTGNTIKIDSTSAITLGSSPNIFTLSYRLTTDSIQYGNLNDNIIQCGGKPIYLVRIYSRIKTLDLSGTTMFGTTEIFSLTSENGAKDLQWDGGKITSGGTNPYFYITAQFRSALLTNLVFTKPNNNWLVRSSNDFAPIISYNVVINGMRAPLDGGGLFGSSTSSAASAITLSDTTAVFIGTRTSEQVVTLPSKIGFANSFRYLTQTGSGYILCQGDSIKTGKGALYYTTNGTTWIRILDNFAVSSGPGGGITALTGDVTASGTGSVAATIANLAVTNAKIANVDASKITTGTVATARLGSGTANSTTALFGDQTYKTVSTPTTTATQIADSNLARTNIAFNSRVVNEVGTTVTVLLDANQYTPTGTAGTNTASVGISGFPLRYQRVGDIVFFQGAISATPSGGGFFDFYLTLPVSSDFTNGVDCSGMVANGSNSDGGEITADFTNNRMKIYMVNTLGTAPRPVIISGSYVIK